MKSARNLFISNASSLPDSRQNPTDCYVEGSDAVELLDGRKLKAIRTNTSFTEEAVLVRSGLGNIQQLIDLETENEDATFRTLLLLARAFELPIKDFMPDSTINVIFGHSDDYIQKTRKRYEKRVAEYPLIGDVQEIDIETIKSIESGDCKFLDDIPWIRYASFADPAIYAVSVPMEASAPGFLLNSTLVVSPGTMAKNGDYCLIYDLSSDKRYIRSILKREGALILQPEENEGSLVLTSSQLIVHKIIGSLGVSQ